MKMHFSKKSKLFISLFILLAVGMLILSMAVPWYVRNGIAVRTYVDNYFSTDGVPSVIAIKVFNSTTSTISKIGLKSFTVCKYPVGGGYSEEPFTIHRYDENDRICHYRTPGLDVRRDLSGGSDSLVMVDQPIYMCDIKAKCLSRNSEITLATFPLDPSEEDLLKICIKDVVVARVKDGHGAVTGSIIGTTDGATVYSESACSY